MGDSSGDHSTNSLKGCCTLPPCGPVPVLVVGAAANRLLSTILRVGRCVAHAGKGDAGGREGANVRLSLKGPAPDCVTSPVIKLSTYRCDVRGSTASSRGGVIAVKARCVRLAQVTGIDFFARIPFADAIGPIGPSGAPP